MLLIANHQSRLRTFIRCLLIGGADVDDVLQETNRILWQKADDYVPGTNFWAWASQVARFEVFNYLRQKQRDRSLPDAELVSQLATIAEHELSENDPRRDFLEDCLSKLNDKQRRLLDLKYASNRSIAEMSGTLNRPEGTIRQTLYRLRETLRECIERKLRAGEPA